ncbi:MAG: hypothetical protein GY822_09350 [Deltaproteobacteria bacterium]|nr:hypothetical protein [Deltaproteobacteria bacterium]
MFLVNSTGDVVGSNRAARIPMETQQTSHVDGFEQLRPNKRLEMIKNAPSNVRLQGTLLASQRTHDDEHIVFRMCAEASPFSWIGQ